MYFLTILTKEARQAGFLVNENPFSDLKEQEDQPISIRLDSTNQADAIKMALEMVEKYKLSYWEVSRIQQIAGCHLLYEGD